MQERQTITRAYEKIFNNCVTHIDFIQRNSLNKFCIWDVPSDQMVDRTLCRDYVIRRLAKLGLSVSIPIPAEPYKLVINWIDMHAPVYSTMMVHTDSAAAPIRPSPTAVSEEETEELEDQETEVEKEESEIPVRRRKRPLDSFFRRVANPSKIVGI